MNFKEVPKFYEFFPLILEEMKKGEAFKREEMYEKLKPLFNEDLQKQTLPSGDNKIFNRIGWAFTYLLKADLIEKSTSKKFAYVITEDGKTALEDCKKQNIKLDLKYLEKLGRNFAINYRNISKDSKRDSPLNFEVHSSKNDIEEKYIQIANTVSEINTNAEVDLLQSLRKMDWEDFEDFCSTLIEKMGYGVAGIREVRTRDGGIDGEIYTDELGIKEKIYIQAKRYDDGNKVTLKDIQAFLHVITSSKSKGIFMTTSKFTKDAQDEAKKYTNLVLIDDKRLIEVCSKYKHGFKVKKTWEILEVDI